MNYDSLKKNVINKYIVTNLELICLLQLIKKF